MLHTFFAVLTIYVCIFFVFVLLATRISLIIFKSTNAQNANVILNISISAVVVSPLKSNNPSVIFDERSERIRGRKMLSIGRILKRIRDLRRMKDSAKLNISITIITIA